MEFVLRAERGLRLRNFKQGILYLADTTPIFSMKLVVEYNVPPAISLITDSSISLE